jgi:uncharacterized membrane protein|nr:DUF2189 domain-containing protein [Thiomonas sp.]
MSPEEAQHQTLSSASAHRVTVCTLTWRDPVVWLRAAWGDMLRCPAVSLSYGLMFTLVVWALGLSFLRRPEYTLMLGSALLLLGPALAMGLIEASRCCEAGIKPKLRPCLACWWKTRSSVALFAVLLLVIELLWARASLLVFALSFDATVPEGHALDILLDPANLGFVLAYLGVGAAFAALAFAICAVSIPLMLDRPVDAITAAITSLRACLEHPFVMLGWGLLIAAVTLLALLPLGLGLMLAWPLVGHASWHAYRGIVCPQTLAGA